jgi:hypothetical protein
MAKALTFHAVVAGKTLRLRRRRRWLLQSCLRFTAILSTVFSSHRRSSKASSRDGGRGHSAIQRARPVGTVTTRLPDSRIAMSHEASPPIADAIPFLLSCAQARAPADRSLSLTIGRRAPRV